MKILFLKDKKITEEELNELERQFTDLYYEHTGISPLFFVEERDYTDYPTVTDADGDKKLTNLYMKEACADVYKRYSGEGTDHVVFLIHEDNWKLTGIWGINYSNLYNGYQVEVCRFDRDNMANSLGTLYHEIHHSHDALIKTYLGVNINPILNVTNYDGEITHGKNPNWDYIRWKENTKSLEIMAPYLRRAYDMRHQAYQKKVGMFKTIKNLAQQVIFLSRRLLFKKKKY